VAAWRDRKQPGKQACARRLRDHHGWGCTELVDLRARSAHALNG